MREQISSGATAAARGSLAPPRSAPAAVPRPVSPHTSLGRMAGLAGRASRLLLGSRLRGGRGGWSSLGRAVVISSAFISAAGISPCSFLARLRLAGGDSSKKEPNRSGGVERKIASVRRNGRRGLRTRLRGDPRSNLGTSPGGLRADPSSLPGGPPIGSSWLPNGSLTGPSSLPGGSLIL